MNIKVSNGDLLDKLSILHIKSKKIYDSHKIANIVSELKYIKIKSRALLKEKKILNLYQALYKINEQIWDIEDKIRLKEKHQNFDDEFIHLARSVYFTNDERARIKKEINILTQSSFTEEKSYTQYKE